MKFRIWALILSAESIIRGLLKNLNKRTDLQTDGEKLAKYDSHLKKDLVNEST